MSYSILIIDADVGLTDRLRQHLERNQWETHVAHSAEQGLITLQIVHPDILLAGQRLPDSSGVALTKAALSVDPQIKIIMVAGDEYEDMAIEAMKAGAFFHVSAPLSLNQFDVVLERALRQYQTEYRLAASERYQSRAAVQGGSLAAIIGESPLIRATKARVQQILEAERFQRNTDLPPVLIVGETGTGKELAVRALHFESTRSSHPFVEINCTSLPPSALEAELFGYERGAFAEAGSRRIGLLEAADGGTLFLDEIGDLDPSSQAKLLKLLEKRIFRRLGSAREREANVRVISASNRDLEQMVRRGIFNGNLYARLRGIAISMPPLRSTGSDILRIARFYLHSLGQRYGKEGLHFSFEAEDLLRRYDWPGNVSELRDTVEQAVLLAQDMKVGPMQLRISQGSRKDGRGLEADAPPLTHAATAAEEELVRKTLEKTDWNVSKSARRLGLSRDMLRYRIQKFGIVRPIE